MKRSILSIAILIVFASCKKDWLDAKPQQSLVTLEAINDIQALMDNTLGFNVDNPAKGEDGNDDFFVDRDTYASMGQDDRHVYTWAAGVDNFYGISGIADWDGPYMAVFNANIASEQIDKITPTPDVYADWARVKGSALFYRAYAFYNLAQLFCKPYMKASAASDLGIIIRTSSNINSSAGRATVQATYDQILNDLLSAKDLLPVAPLKYKTQPSKNAAFAMLARVYLSMEEYEKARTMADSSLMINDQLLDYNQAGYPFTLYNQEVIYHAFLRYSIISAGEYSLGHVDTGLYAMYAPDDLRKTNYFTENAPYNFHGNYTGDYTFFGGLAIDEMYLIKAETNARLGQLNTALGALNTLLDKRYKTGTYTPVTTVDPDEALSIILDERRKELCFRGIRWTDLRRLRTDSRFAKTLKRKIDNLEFELPPNEIDRFVLPIPDNEILYSKVPQNPR